MSFLIDIYLNEPCCTDVTKLVCFTCRSQIAERLYILARNLGVAGALCRAHEIGYTACPCLGAAGALCPCDERSIEWHPGCGRSAL